MSRDDWEHALVRALVERPFRARLLADPAGALAEYGLAAHMLWLSGGPWRGRDGYALLAGR